MSRCVISLLLLALPMLMAAKVWVGKEIDPQNTSLAHKICAQTEDVGTDPTDPQLAAALLNMLGDGVNPPTKIGFMFESTPVPANVCQATKCEAVGAVLCAKETGFAAQGSTIFLGHCVTYCAAIPVEDNAPHFWVAVECP